MATINDISDDVLCRILSYIHIYQRQQLEIVCKQWRSIIRRIWNGISKLTITLNNDIPEIIQVENDIPGETHFSIDFMTMPAVKAILKLCEKNLTELTIQYEGPPDVDMAGTFEPLRQCRNLKSFEVYSYEDLFIQECLESLPMNSLQQLAILHAQDEFDEALDEAINNVLEEAQALTSLRVSSFSLPVLAIIEKMCALKSLDLGCYSYTLKLDGSSLNTTELVNLEKLYVQDERLVEDKFLIEVAKNCRKLRKIKLWSGNSILDGLKALETLPNLRCVDLRLPKKIEILNYFSNLEEFYCDLTDRSSVTEETLTKFLQRSPNLKICDFHNDSLHDLFDEIAAKAGTQIEYQRHW